MNQIVIISPLEAIDVFKQLGFDALVSHDGEVIRDYIEKHIREVKVFIYDLELKDLITPIRQEYKTQAFPIFAFNSVDDCQCEYTRD